MYERDQVNRTALACDGPLNGQYITAEQAAEHGYELCNWQWEGSEKVYMLPVVRDEQSEGLTRGV